MSNRPVYLSGFLLLACGLFCLAGKAIAAEGDMSNPVVYIAGYNKTISCFAFDPSNGTLKLLSTSDGGQNPTYLAFHPSHKFLYAANEVNEGRVTAFSINPKDGSLTKLNDASAAGHGPCHISVHPSGKWVLTGNYGSGHVGVLPIKADGSVGEPVCTEHPGNNAHMALCDPSGKYVFVPCLGSDYVAQYLIDENTGKLTPNNPPTSPTAPKQGPRHMAFHPSMRFAYLINELGLTMDSLNYDAASGKLSAPETLPTLPEGANRKGCSTAHVVVTPNGKFVYGSNRGNNTIVIYSVNSETGRLTLVGHEDGGGDVKTPRDFTIDPSGKYLIVANQSGNSVTVYRCDANTGKLEKLNTTQVPSGPSFAAVISLP